MGADRLQRAVCSSTNAFLGCSTCSPNRVRSFSEGLGGQEGALMTAQMYLVYFEHVISNLTKPPRILAGRPDPV